MKGQTDMHLDKQTEGDRQRDIDKHKDIDKHTNKQI
jgi:hypothetical protein